MASSYADDGSFHKADSFTCAGMSSRSSLFSRIDSAGHHAPPSLLRDNGMLFRSGCSVEKPSAERAEPPKPKQGALMRKLSRLISPKKKAPKPGTSKRVSSMQEGSSGDGGADAKDHLELLFAQAEASLGELLVKAGASFNSKSASREDHQPYRHHPQERALSSGGAEIASVSLGSSFNRSSTIMRQQGHARRNSLSRVWQQLGESLFCGSGHVNALALEEMELRGIAPIPRTHSDTYFSNDIYDDAVTDESYWQSLAESILKQRQKEADKDESTDHPLDEQSIRENRLEASHDLSVASVSSLSQHARMPSREQEPECMVSEIISAPPDIEVGRQDDVCRWEACAMAEDSYSELLVPTELRDRCPRLNTTLEASPVLVHNYSLGLKSRGGSVGEGSSSNSAVELLNSHSCPSSTLSADQVVEPVLAHTVALSSGVMCVSNAAASALTLEDSSWHARGECLAASNETYWESPSNAAASCTASSSVESGAKQQQQLESVNSARVSLMTLLHEEATAAEFVDVPDVVEDVPGQQVQAVVPQDEEGLVGEEPLVLLCCVCMVRRKGAALIPCGHTFCRVCSKQLFAGRGACPLCNNLIVQLLDIF